MGEKEVDVLIRCMGGGGVDEDTWGQRVGRWLKEVRVGSL